MNMFKAVKAKTVKEYLDSIGDDRRPDIKSLHLLIQKTSAKFKPWLAYNMLGYGVFKYSNYKKEIIDWPLVALASQKNYISLYICAVDKNGYLAEQHKKELGNVSVGKSCIRFKKLADLNLKVLDKVLKSAAKSPGLVIK
jgi:hypothetical protein